MSNTEKKLFILDAFALIYRAYFAYSKRPLINSKGVNTSATFGFLNTILDILNKENPSHLAIAFDSPGPTTRALEFDFYKANREEMPEDIRSALPYIKKMVEGLNIPLLALGGYEADDIIGTLTKMAAKDDVKVYMVSSDKDLGQLVNEYTFLYKPPYMGRPKQILGVAEICERWQIEDPMQVIDILGLMGDSVDNIPGIPGVGEKTAMKLLKQFGSIENLLENTDQLKGKLKEKVENNKDKAIISKKLATIICDVPIEYDFDTYKIDPPNKELLMDLFAELEFRNVGKKLFGDAYSVTKKVNKPLVAGQQLDLFAAPAQVASIATETTSFEKNISNTEHDYQIIDTPKKRASLLKKLLKQKEVAFDTETTGLNANEAELVGISFSYKSGEAFYVPIPAEQTEAQAIVDEFKPFFSSDKIVKIGQNIKYDMLILKWYGIEVEEPLSDTMIAHYLIEPSMRHNLTILSETYLNYTPVPIESLIGKKGKNQLSMRDVSAEKIKEYAGEDADLTFQLYQKFSSAIEKDSLKTLYTDVEMPLVPVLTAIEHEGITIDVPFLQAYSEELKSDLAEIQESVFELSGANFNLDSPAQLGTVLFDTMEIPYKGKKTKTGKYSTNEAILKELTEYPIVNKVLQYRELNKLHNTYVATLPELVNPKSNRIHSSFNQTVTATGRLSSTQPNLQNIPIRRESGRKIRQAFIPRIGGEYTLMAADYSQIELRIMAAMSEDKNMIHAFQNGLDIHTATAAKVYGIDMKDVDSSLRRYAKMVNFGIIYGISAHGLGQRLGIKRKEAKVLIDNYFAQYPNIKIYMDSAVQFAEENGYVQTLLGRRRYLNDINSRNHTVRQFAQRTAINTPIQGSAADMIKVAMVKVYREMQKRQLKSKMILQVHDELLFDAHLDEVEELRALVVENMQNAMPLKVPIVVDVDTGANWLEAH